MKDQVEQIRDQLINQPYEDVYMAHFARKEWTIGLYDVFLKSFNTTNVRTSELNSEKINLLKNWVKAKFEYDPTFYNFPSFIEFYIDQFYKEDGLRYFFHEGNKLVFEKGMENILDLEEYVFEFESKLLKKAWWSDEDNKLWMDLERKKRVVKNFEDYIYNFEKEIIETWGETEELSYDNYKIISQKHIKSIKFEIATIKLFKGDIEKIPILENLINYLDARSSVEKSYLDLISKGEVGQVRVEQSLKLNLLHQFGIIEFLRSVWKKNQIVKPIEFLLEKLIAEKHTSIQPRLTNKDDKKLRTIAGNQKLEKFLDDFNLEQDQIKYP
ncbi:MAG: hypothetical protein WBB02_04035 [Saprospiraceae bacterium]